MARPIPSTATSGRALGALALAILLWPLAGQANIPRIPFPELPRASTPELPFVVRYRAELAPMPGDEMIELARVPVGAVRVPCSPPPGD